MPKKSKKKVKDENKDKNGAFGTANSTSSSVKSENKILNATPDEIKNLIKTNAIKLDSVKSKQDLVMKDVKSMQGVMLMKEQVNKYTHNLPECDELKKIRSEYKESQADLSNQLKLINHKLAQKELLVKSLNTQIKSLKEELLLKAQEDSKNQSMGMEELKVMVKEKESFNKSFNNQIESLKQELHAKSQKDTEMLMEEFKLNNRKNVTIINYPALIITLIIISIIFGVKKVLFIIVLYFLVKYFLQRLIKYISSLLAKFVAYTATFFP